MPTHSVDQFNYGMVSLNTYLLEKALQHQKNQRARTYVVSNCVIGYFTLVYGSAFTAQKNYIPLILLARVAVDKSKQGKGLGKALLK